MGQSILQGKGTNAITELTFPKTQKTKFIRITQTGEAKGNYWKAFMRLQVLKPAVAARKRRRLRRRWRS